MWSPSLTMGLVFPKRFLCGRAWACALCNPVPEWPVEPWNWTTIQPAERNRLLAEAQKLVANDAVAAYLYQPTWITVANARVKGLWKDMPIFANDLSVIAWE